MAPIRKIEKMGDLEQIPAFIEALGTRLQQPDLDSAILDDIKQKLKAISLSAGRIPATARETLDTKGTWLWNIVTRLNRRANNSETDRVLVYARALSFFVIHYGCPGSRTDFQGTVRLLRIALKCSHKCLEHSEIDLCLKVAEQAAQYEAILTKLTQELDGEARVNVKKLSGSYFAIRIALAWKQSRLEIAEHMYTKVTSSISSLDISASEDLAELLFGIGNELLHDENFQLAVLWLQRSYDVVSNQEYIRLSPTVAELRLYISQSCITALIGLGDDDSIEKARGFHHILETEYPDNHNVHHLNLDLLSIEGNSDSQTYFDVLSRLGKSMEMTEPNVRITLQKIQRLKDKGQYIACKALDELLFSRLIDLEKSAMAEKVIVTRIWITLNDTSADDPCSSIKGMVEGLSKMLSEPLSASAAHAIQALLWKQVEANYQQSKFLEAEDWSQLALSDIFKNGGPLNKAVLLRKLVHCATSRKDSAAAREVYQHMDAAAREVPLSRFLMFRVSLQTGDEELSTECLEALCKSSIDSTLLYACVLEAQKHGNRHQTAGILQRILFKYDWDVPGNVHLPALLRCTIRLIMGEMDGVIPLRGAVESLCKLFRGAVTAASKRGSQATNEADKFSIVELDWFSRTSYNLAFKYCTVWEYSDTLCLLDSCKQFIDIYPLETSQGVRDNLHLRRMFCNFLGASLLTMLARTEDDMEKRLQECLKCRKHVDGFRKGLEDRIIGMNTRDRANILKKFACLLAFDFEAAIRLKSWNDLHSIVEESSITESSSLLCNLADLILCSDASPKTTIAILEKIINQSQLISSQPIASTSRWIRCIFQLALNDEPAIAEQLLNTVVSISKSCRLKDTLYPAEELEWIATTVFNRAVDFYCAKEDRNCETWVEKALMVAGELASRDDGLLKNLLQEKYQGLKFD